jgi:hypothetical protein
MARVHRFGSGASGGSLNRLALLLIVSVSAWYLILGFEFEVHQPQLPYFVTEWMITFAGGFVRRGLLGQSFWSLGALLHTNPLALILGARLAIAGAYLSILGFQLYRRRQVLGILGICVILLNPLLCFYVWFSLGSFDLAFLLVTVLHLWLSRRPGEGYIKWATLLFATVGVFMVLSHEAFLLLGMPLNLIITWTRFQGNAFRGRRLAKTATVFAMPVVAALVSAHFHGNAAQAAAILQTWNRRGVQLPDGSAIVYLPQSLPGEFAYVWSWMSPFRLGFWALATLVCVVPLILLWVQFLKSASAFDRQRLVQCGWRYAGIPILCTFPLYFIGTDWNRWLALPFATGTVCLLTVAPLSAPFACDRRMKSYFLGLLAASLFNTPTALYYSVGGAANGPLVASVRLFWGGG